MPDHNGPTDMESSTGQTLIAPCGMNCSLCMVYQRKRNSCPGCRHPVEGQPVSRSACKIKTCDKLLSEFCSGCNDFPCRNLQQLDKRYQLKYHMSMIGNLETIRENGIGKFLESEKVRWNCTNCGATLCVHKAVCPGCSAKHHSD